MNYKVYYAQNREDIILSAFFDKDRKGFYIDVGANDPDVDSVTKYFYEKGWSGINIEPIQYYYDKLVKERPRDTNLRVGVASKSGEAIFREYTQAGGLSTFSTPMKEGHEKVTLPHTAKFKEYNVATIPLRDILKENRTKHIDFMKIDVEGFEYEVIQSNDWSKYRPSVLCVEANHIDKDWRPLLKKNDYVHKFSDGLNEYYVALEYENKVKDVTYPTALLSTPLVPAVIDDEYIQRAKTRLLTMETLLTQEKLEVDRLNNEITQLHFQLHNAKRIRNLLKMLAWSTHDAVLAYIELLNKPQTQKRFDLDIPKSGIKDQLLALREYDLKTFYSKRGDGRVVYRVVKSSYTGLARLIKRSLKATIRFLLRKEK